MLPASASAVVNFRLLPGDSVAEVLGRVRDAIDDPRVSVEPLAGLAAEASPVAPTDAEGFRQIRRAIADGIRSFR